MLPYLIPSIPAIPKIPLFQKKLNPKKELKCLNLKEVVNPNIETNTIFNLDMNEISFNEDEIDGYFKLIKQSKIEENINSKIENSSTKTESEKEIEISSLIDNNKYTVIYISIKKLNNLLNFNSFVENLHLIFEEDTTRENEEIFKLFTQILFNQDLLNSLSLILLNDNEINAIKANLGKINKDNLIRDTERWLIKFCNYPQFKIIINTLQKMFANNFSLEEINKTLDIILCLYSIVVENKKIQKFFNIILRINNYLNKETGKKEIKGFDIRTIDLIMSMKLNSISLFNYLMQVYFNNSQIEKENSYDIDSLLFFSKKDEGLIENIIEPTNSVNNLSEIVMKIKECNMSDLFKISEILPQNILKDEFRNFSSNIEKQLSIIEEKLEKENFERNFFLKYFNLYEDKMSNYDVIVSVFKTIININSKMKVYFSQNYNNKNDSKDSSDKKEFKKDINNVRKSSKCSFDLKANYLNMKYKL